MEATQDEVRHLFDYDPTEPLALRWRNPPLKARVMIGAVAGYWHAQRAGSKILQRYVDISGRRTPLHHVVWVWHKGLPVPHNFGPKIEAPEDFRVENLVLNPRRAPPEKLKTKRVVYWRRWRDSFTDDEWSIYLRERNLRRDRGITPDTYARLLAEQSGVCAICKRPETMVRKGKIEVLSIDHCHSGGGIRGLLCVNCNNGLGRFRDNPALLRAAADYLERHQLPRTAVAG